MSGQHRKSILGEPLDVEAYLIHEPRLVNAAPFNGTASTCPHGLCSIYVRIRKRKGVIIVTSRSTELLREALALPPDERAEMAEHLLSSLDSPTDRRIEELWAKETEERLDAFERGEIKTVRAKVVFDQIGRKAE
jgi:putative addiction module component (TIGR02574 family)